MEEEELVCTNAILAAVNLIQKKCGGKSPKLIELDRGLMVWVPNPVPGLKEEITCEERVLKGLATKLFGIRPEDPGYEEAVKRAALRIARGAVPGCEYVDIEELLKRWT